MRPKNQKIDVFKYINMLTGPEWTDPVSKKTSRCWPFTGVLNNKGRPYFQVDGKKYLAYRLAYELTTGQELGDKMFRHKCDNQICCNPMHGEPGDHQQNMDDMKERERHGLSHHMVRAIRKMAEAGRSDEEIANFTQLDKSTINRIRNRKNYDHVED